MSTWLKLNISPIDKKVTQSPPWGNPPVPPWSHLFHVHENVSLLPHLPFWNCFVILCSNFIYFTRPSNSSDSVISLTDSLSDDKMTDSTQALFFKRQCSFPSSSPDKSANPNAAVGCLKKLGFRSHWETSLFTNKCISPNLAMILFLLMLSLECMKR